MSDFSLILVLQFKTSVNRNKTWQRYKYVIGDKIVYIENSDGNTNVRFY